MIAAPPCPVSGKTAPDCIVLEAEFGVRIATVMAELLSPQALEGPRGFLPGSEFLRMGDQRRRGNGGGERAPCWQISRKLAPEHRCTDRCRVNPMPNESCCSSRARAKLLRSVCDAVERFKRALPITTR